MRVRTLLPSDGSIRRRAKITPPTLGPEARFAVPRTLVVTSRATLDAALRQLAFPFYLKGSFADAAQMLRRQQALDVRLIVLATDAFADGSQGVDVADHRVVVPPPTRDSKRSMPGVPKRHRNGHRQSIPSVNTDNQR